VTKRAAPGGRGSSTPRALQLAVPACLLVASLTVGLASSSPPPRRTPSAKPAVSGWAHADGRWTGVRGPGIPSRPPTGPHSPAASPRAVALRFAHGWLDCTYHQAPCSRVPGILAAYAAALARQQGSSLATPAELAARPRIVSLTLTPSCRRAAVALATYSDGEGGRFQLHVNLVREHAGWRVFDVAEAPPHIPLPPPLSHGPHGC
jgi:hypothetical protein